MADKELMERTIDAWDPLRGMFDDFLMPMRMPAIPPLPKAWAPRIDISETDKEYLLTAALPGVRKEDVKVEVKDDVLTISGERKAEKEEKGKTWLRKETSYGFFQRSLVLPEGVHPEEVKATHKDGLLTVAIGKPSPAKSRGVSVKVD
jgi:HSP20 family protein